MSSFSNYSDFERQQMIAMREQELRDLDCLQCKECSCAWFEEVEVARFKSDHHLVLGQQIPTHPGSVPFRVLRCMRCGHLQAPRIIHQTRDLGGKGYDHFMDSMKGYGDTRKKPEEPEEPGDPEEEASEIPAEKL